MKIFLDKDAYMPVRAHSTDAGLDLKAREDFVIPAYSSAIIDTGVHKWSGYSKNKKEIPRHKEKSSKEEYTRFASSS